MAEETLVQIHRHPDRRHLASLRTQNRSLTDDEGGGALGADHATRETGQDRGQGRAPRSLRHVPIARSRRAPEPVSANPAPDR